jgi:hypothetical protein
MGETTCPILQPLRSFTDKPDLKRFYSGSHCCFNCHPEELALAVVELAEYEHRGEAYATEQLWKKSNGL